LPDERRLDADAMTEAALSADHAVQAHNAVLLRDQLGLAQPLVRVHQQMIDAGGEGRELAMSALPSGPDLVLRDIVASGLDSRLHAGDVLARVVHPVAALGPRPNPKSREPLSISEEGFKMAERTGLEPAASGVTGRRYNRLNYHSAN